MTDGHASRCMAARDLTPCWAHAVRLGQAAGPMTDDDGSQARKTATDDDGGQAG